MLAISGMVVAGLLVLMFGLDLAVGIPFGKAAGWFVDEILPRDWRETEPEDVVEADGYGVGSGPEPASGGGPQVRIR